MPVRERVEDALREELIGGTVYHFGEPRDITREDHDAVTEFASHIYARVIERIDWPRVLIEAAAICIERGDHDLGGNADVNEVMEIRKRPCWRCLETALLSYEHSWVDDAVRADHAPGVRYPPRGWRLPRELRYMMIGWVRARRKSLTEADEGAG